MRRRLRKKLRVGEFAPAEHKPSGYGIWRRKSGETQYALFARVSSSATARTILDDQTDDADYEYKVRVCPSGARHKQTPKTTSVSGVR